MANYYNNNNNPVKTISRFVLQNLAAKALGPVLPPYWQTVGQPVNDAAHYQFDNMSDDELADLVVSHASGVPMVLPVTIGYQWDKENAFLLPVEPLVSIQGRNNIKRRYPKKASADRSRRGSVKEYWMQDDYSVRIQGVFLHANSNTYPADNVSRLREFCEAGETLYIKCPLLELFNIDGFVIENYEIPFTAGTNTQAYNITGYSDDIQTLLVENRPENV